MPEVIEIGDSPADNRKAKTVAQKTSYAILSSEDEFSEVLPELRRSTSQATGRATAPHSLVAFGSLQEGEVSRAKYLSRTDHHLEVGSNCDPEDSYPKNLNAIISLDSDTEDCGSKSPVLRAHFQEVVLQEINKSGNLSNTILSSIETIVAKGSASRKRKLDDLDQTKTGRDQRRMEDQMSAKEAKARLKAQKAQDKERRQEEKRQAQRLAAVNKLKQSKKDCTPEMIIEVCSQMKDTAFAMHLVSGIEALGCMLCFEQAPVPGLIRFRRRIKAEYDSSLGHWQPLEHERVDEENRVIVVLRSQEFVQLLKTEQLAHHVHAVKRSNPAAMVIYVLEGIQAMLRKQKTMRNRAFSEAVRSGSTMGLSDEGLNEDQNDEDSIEDALLNLQISHGCMIVQTSSPKDSAEQITVLTSDISTIPYKLGRSSASSSFCTDAGQIKTGNDPVDTLEKMLMQIRLTQPTAQAIVKKYKSFPALCHALRDNPDALQNIPKVFNTDHSMSHMVLGCATSRKVWRALMPMDPFLDV